MFELGPRNVLCAQCNKKKSFFSRVRVLPDELKATKTMSMGEFVRNVDVHSCLAFRNAFGDVLMSVANGARI